MYQDFFTHLKFTVVHFFAEGVSAMENRLVTLSFDHTSVDLK